MARFRNKVGTYLTDPLLWSAQSCFHALHPPFLTTVSTVCQLTPLRQFAGLLPMFELDCIAPSQYHCRQSTKQVHPSHLEEATLPSRCISQHLSSSRSPGFYKNSSVQHRNHLSPIDPCSELLETLSFTLRRSLTVSVSAPYVQSVPSVSVSPGIFHVT